jgi:hypothetical protein
VCRARHRRPLSEVEKDRTARCFDDGRVQGRRAVAAPGAGAAEAEQLLAWRPNVRVGQFVPRGGLAQEGRYKNSTLRAISGR